MRKTEHNIKLLIADDEVEFVSTLKTRLSLRGYQVEMTTSGTDTLTALTKGSPDVLVLDLKMPDLDGFEVLRKIKVDYPSLPVIILTGHGGSEAGAEGIALGAFDYLMKPIDLNLLIRRLEDAYNGSAQPARQDCSAR